MTEPLPPADLHASEDELSCLLLENVTDYAIFFLATDGRIARWNIGAERILGYTEAEILGHSVAILFTPEDQAAGAPQQELQQAEQTGRAEDERWHMCQDGSRFRASGILTALRTENGALRGYAKILRDVTARHLAEAEKERLLQALEVERARLSRLFQQAPAFIAVLRGPQHIFEMANPLYCQLSGHRELLGKPVRDALPEVEEQGFFELLDAVYNTGQPFVGQDMPIRLQVTPEAAIQERYLDFVYQPLHEADGSVSGIFVQGVDQTLRRQAQLQIELLNARLRRVVRETHHRVKNNLQIISALAEVQMEEGIETVPASALIRIGHHTRSLASIHDLLTHAAKSNIETDSLSTAVTLKKLIPLLTAAAGGRSIHYRTDDFQLSVQQMGSLCLLINELVANALKHGKSEVELTLTVSDDKARLEVCDNGPGFPAGFDVRRAANTGLDLIDSTGRHDLRGTITYENRLPKGARVIVTFPAPALSAQGAEGGE